MAAVTASPQGIGPSATSGVMWRAAGFACLSICSYVVAVVLARELGPAAYSIYGVVYSVLMASELILRLGVPQSLTKLIGGERSRVSTLEATGVTLAVAINLVAFVLLWVAGPTIAGLLNLTEGERLVRIAIIDLPFFAAYLTLSHVLLGRRDFKASGIATCIYGLTKAVGIVLLAVTDSLTIEGALLVNIGASIIGIASLLPRVGFASAYPTLEATQKIVQLAVPITIADVGSQILVGIDLWALNALGEAVPAETKGHYVAALSLARLPNVAAFVLASVLIPSIARALASGETARARPLVLGATRFLAALLLPACAMIAGNASDLLGLLYSDAYVPGGQYLVVLIFAHGLGLTCLLTLQAILVSGDAAAIGARAIYVGVVAATVLSWILIPRFGASGAGYGAVLAYSIAIALLGRAVWRRFGCLIEVQTVRRAVPISLAIGVTGWLLPWEGGLLVLEFMLLSMLYLALAAASGLIRRDDIIMLRSRAT